MTEAETATADAARRPGLKQSPGDAEAAGGFKAGAVAAGTAVGASGSGKAAEPDSVADPPPAQAHMPRNRCSRSRSVSCSRKMRRSSSPRCRSSPSLRRRRSRILHRSRSRSLDSAGRRRSSRRSESRHKHRRSNSNGRDKRRRSNSRDGRRRSSSRDNLPNSKNGHERRRSGSQRDTAKAQPAAGVPAAKQKLPATSKAKGKALPALSAKTSQRSFGTQQQVVAREVQRSPDAAAGARAGAAVGTAPLPLQPLPGRRGPSAGSLAASPSNGRDATGADTASPPAAVPKRTGGAASGRGTRQAAVVAAKATTPQPQLQLQPQQHVEGPSYWAGWANIHDRDAWQGGAAAAEWYAGRQAAETAAAAYTASQQASVNCTPAGWQSLSQAATAAAEQAAANMAGAGQAAPQPMAKQGRHATAAGITQPAASVTFAAAPPWQRGTAPLHTGLDTQAAGAAGHALTQATPGGAAATPPVQGRPITLPPPAAAVPHGAAPGRQQQSAAADNSGGNSGDGYQAPDCSRQPAVKRNFVVEFEEQLVAKLAVRIVC